MSTAPDLRNRMKFWHFLKVLQNSWDLQNLLESPSETCMWNLRQFGEVKIFDRKMPAAPTPSKWDDILTFSQFSPKFMKLTEFIGITTRNMHVKLEAVWRSYNFLWENAVHAGALEIGWNLKFSQSSLKFMKLRGAQWLSGRVLDSRQRGRGFEPHKHHCVVVLEHDTFILA